ncbi:hypothetical protein AUP68_11025 [Ilyonectria robusta]
MLSGNVTNVLIGMGLEAEMEACSTHMQRVIFLTWDDGKAMTTQEYPAHASPAEGGPSWQVHRADVHTCLLKKAQEVGVTIRMGVLVKNYDWDAPVVVLEDGTVLNADVMVAADVSAFYPFISLLIKYTLYLLFSTVGQGRHVLGYPIRGGQDYNVVYTQPLKRSLGSKYVTKVDPAEVLEEYKDWDPRVVAFTKHLPKDGVLEWRLCDLNPLEDWVFPGDMIVLIGDASHAMIPSAAQGAAMGIEDGAAIAELHARADTEADVPRILRTFQNLRKPRCINVVENGTRDARSWHDKKDPTYKPTSNWVWVYDVKKASRDIPLEREA